ncbi:LacI family DNA-binding transcriptional regulator [Sphingomonas sp. LHG3406-1]|uniref:LacI family DNA-binding transcriptional regulator n=1 Tax=Sphingomonas sp. LHG3406-1 TaxID=2804617 RepID=UPI002621E6D3|nr:LacI family DNA-binding transcriptional regulator [Sphingomonas sp. LHG3406-1]
MSKASRRGRGNVTIEDVAREAGVSTMTVSRVINKGKNVREETRDNVLQAIEKLRYSPNTAARSLAAGQATRIGLFYSNPSAAYLSQFLVGSLQTARSAGCHLMLEPCESENPALQREAAQQFIDAGVEGVILPPPVSESTTILEELRKAEIPVVTVAMGRVHNPLNVRMDDYAAAVQLTQYLIDLGHRRLGHITGAPGHIATSERERGFRDVARQAGIADDQLSIEPGEFTFRSGLDAADALLSLPEPPTAIFASNDDMAAAVVSVAHRRGLQVPDDLSVVGFDDTSLATSVWPELTTIRQPVSAMAGAALEMLLGALRFQSRGEDAGSIDRVLDHELIIRGSAAAPPKQK